MFYFHEDVSLLVGCYFAEHGSHLVTKSLGISCAPAARWSAGVQFAPA
jgi:hypothetical protein